MATAALFHPVAVDGFRGRYLVSGEGPPLVLLPTQLALARAYRPTIDALARSFRVYAVEMPGSGGGERLAKPWTIAQYAAWVSGFLDAEALERASLVGHSCSGAVAL